MYFDEDGDLAHEFYEEIKKGGKRKMKRVDKNLTPQVWIKDLHSFKLTIKLIVLHLTVYTSKKLKTLYISSTKTRKSADIVVRKCLLFDVY